MELSRRPHSLYSWPAVPKRAADRRSVSSSRSSIASRFDAGSCTANGLFERIYSRPSGDFCSVNTLIDFAYLISKVVLLLVANKISTNREQNSSIPAYFAFTHNRRESYQSSSRH